MLGKHTKVTILASLRPADHICIWDRSRPISYQHHGLVWVAGDSARTIQVVHIWSPLSNMREAQADSHFRVSTLEEFLSNRKLKDLRLVQYHASGLNDVVRRWGEVHLSKSDIPEVTLARARYILGLGREKFHIITQNCEHAAHWCKTGEQWCKQSLTKGRGIVPFEDMATPERIQNLFDEIEQIKRKALKDVEAMLNIAGSNVYLQVNESYFVHVSGRLLQVVPKDDISKPPTAFRLLCSAKSYNCITVSFFCPETKEYMYSHSSFCGKRPVEMTKLKYFHNINGIKRVLSCHGDMQSMHQHRRYLGVRNNVLVDVNKREECAQFVILPILGIEQDNQQEEIHFATTRI